MKGLIKGVWAFCLYLFWPRWGRNWNSTTMDKDTITQQELVPDVRAGNTDTQGGQEVVESHEIFGGRAFVPWREAE